MVALLETVYLSNAASFSLLLKELPVETAAVQVQATGLRSDSAINSFEQDVRQRASDTAHGILREAVFRVESSEFFVSSFNGRLLPTSGQHSVALTLANHSDLQSSADLIAGAWSIQPPPGFFSITLSDSGAARLAAEPGDRLCIVTGPRSGSICLLVAGIWKPRDSKSPYWVDDFLLPLEAEVSRTDLTSPVVTSASNYHQATLVLELDQSRIAQLDPAVVQASLPLVASAVTGNQPSRQVVTGLDSAVLDFDNRSRVATFALQLVTVQLWLAGLYCLLFLVGLRLEQDRDAVAMWRTHGWPRRLVAGLLASELIFIAVLAVIPGVVLGLLLAIGLTAAIYPTASLAIGPSLGAAAPWVGGGLLVLALAIVGLAVGAARAEVMHRRAQASRPPQRWWNRPWVAVAAVAFSIPILAQARSLGDARVREAGGSPPFDLLLPGAGLALVAFAGVQLLPVSARGFGRIYRGLEARLAAMQLARASGRQQTLSALLVAALALALLAAANSGTTALNTSDRAAYAVGADLRVTTRDQQATDVDGIHVVGAVSDTQVFRSTVGVGPSRQQVPALGVDPGTFARTAWTRPGLMPQDLDSMMRSLATGGGGGASVVVRVRALLSSGLLAANGAAPGDTISMELDNTPVNALVVGSFDYFPTLYGDGVVFSLPALLDVLGDEGYSHPWPNELWVAGPAAQLQADEATLSENPVVFSVVSRADLVQAAAADPIGLAGQTNLILGFVATCVLAVTAFAIFYAFAARSRSSEYAILEANGLSPGQVVRSLLWEEVFVVVFSTALGCVLGAVLAVVILPGLQVSTALADTIPPTVLAMNPWLAVDGIVVTVGLCLLVGYLLARPSRGVDVMSELRSMG